MFVEVSNKWLILSQQTVALIRPCLEIATAIDISLIQTTETWRLRDSEMERAGLQKRGWSLSIHHQQGLSSLSLWQTCFIVYAQQSWGLCISVIPAHRSALALWYAIHWVVCPGGFPQPIQTESLTGKGSEGIMPPFPCLFSLGPFHYLADWTEFLSCSLVRHRFAGAPAIGPAPDSCLA